MDGYSLNKRPPQISIYGNNGVHVKIGNGSSIKLNTSIGISSSNNLGAELKKVDTLINLDNGPDLFMDLSIVNVKKPLYQRIRELTDKPIGIIPYYTCRSSNGSIDPSRLIEEMYQMAESGIGFFTLHPTPRMDLLRKAIKTRKLPLVSRGAGVIYRDMIINNRDISILDIVFPEIVNISKKFGIVISIGAAFRPGSVYDALDLVQLMDIDIQEYYIKNLLDAGLPVMMEGIGHIKLSDFYNYCKRIKKNINIPVMPLGPLFLDDCNNNEDILNVIGAIVASQTCCVDVINTITAEEHSGGIPSTKALIRSIKIARIALSIINSKEKSLDQNDKQTYNCFNTDRRDIGCARCDTLCPLSVVKLFKELDGELG